METITKNRPDFFVLLFLQLLNVVGGYDSLGVGTAVAALKACVELKAQGIRDVHQTINAALLVCITLSADSAVPAELGLYEGNPVQIDQTALTIKSFPGQWPWTTTPTVVRTEIHAIVVDHQRPSLPRRNVIKDL